jgi:hypothetical protein
MLHGIGLADVLAALTDDHGQLGFVVDLVGHGCAGQHHIVGRPHHAFGHFGEHDGPSLGVGVAVLEHGRLQFFGVRMVVAAHAPDVAARHGQGRLEFDRGHGQRCTRQGRQRLSGNQGLNDGLRPTLGL